MSHKHEHLIDSIFRDPISANIHWRECCTAPTTARPWGVRTSSTCASFSAVRA